MIINYALNNTEEKELWGDFEDVSKNGLTAMNQKYQIMFEGPSLYGPPMDLICTVSSPDGVNLVYTEVSFEAAVN